MAEPFQNQGQSGVSPLVTVAMPVFNAGRHLRLAVLSIVRQTFTDWELLIIDDGSTDHSLQEIDDIRDDRIRIFRDGTNKGLAVRLNEGIDLARGCYFARMDQDDVSYPERFARQVEALEKDPLLDLVAVRAVTISDDNRMTGMLPCAPTQEEISVKPWRGFYLPHPTWMGRIEWFRKYRYAEPGPYFCEDQELLLRSYKQSRFGMIVAPLFAYRLRKEVHWRKLIKTRLTVLPVQLKHFLPRGELFFALMALLTLIGRLTLDVLKPILGIAYPLVRNHGGEASRQWQAILGFINDEPGHVVENPVLQENIFNPLKYIAPVLWVVFFCYATCAALIFQKLLLPLVPSLHAGGGLLSNDAAYFDSLAWNIAQWIQLHGWRSFEPFVVSAHVTAISILYMIFGHDPTLIVPVNAAVHATGGLLIFLVTRELSGKEPIGAYAGIVASGLFILFPSALNWYGQLHKDGYAIVGTLLILLTLLKAVRRPTAVSSWIALVTCYVAGVMIVASVRPYNLKILLFILSGAWLAILVAAALRRQLRRSVALLLFFLMGMAVLGGAETLIQTEKAKQVELGIQNAVRGIQDSPFIHTAFRFTAEESYVNLPIDNWQWQKASWLPDRIENIIELAARMRAGLIDYGLRVKAKSLIDPDIAPRNITKVVCYLPRGLQVGMFAPFPSSWLANISISRMVAAGEMFIYYLCIPGILFLLWYNRSPAVLLSLYFSSFFLLVQGFTIANLGTLYRLRYGFLFILLLMGVLGWFTWLDRSGRLQRIERMLKPAVPWVEPGKAPVPAEDRALIRREAVGAGFWVMVLTFLCFLGFFLRDLLMARTFGLGAQTDNFFIALLIPMFIVTVFYLPLGAAFIPIYLEVKERLLPQAARMLVESVSSWTFASLLIACLILYLSGPSLLPLLYAQGSFPDMAQLGPLLNLALPILLFSGVVILGNSVLNANGRAVSASAAQLVVPVAAVMALLLFGGRYGVQSVMYGMVVGQLLNLFIVQYCLKRNNVSILPCLKFQYQTDHSLLLKQYWPLAVSALFISLVLPVAMLLAMSLPDGSVSAFNLGTKIVLFVTGLVGTAISAVILPYFSSLVVKNQLVAARRELSFFLMFAILISVPVSAGLFLWSAPIVRLLFEGGSFNSSATEQVTRVMQYSVVQLPFFICNSLLLKFATATRHVIIISAVALVGLLVNIVAGVLLMKHMGVGGIALGASLSMLVSTVLLLLVFTRNGYVTGLDAVIMLLNWLLFITLLMCFHFQSGPSIYVTILAYALLMGGYFTSLKFDKNLTARTNP
jgi:putative peptidoglycan lipid II flippase